MTVPPEDRMTELRQLFFETAAEKYDWLNRKIAIGTGYRPPEGPVYDIFEVL